MRIHLLGIFHTIHSSEFSHCAFTGKAMRFSKMLGEHYDIIEYANEGSESVSCTMEVMLTREEIAKFYPREPHEFIGKWANVGTPGCVEFSKRLLERLQKNVKPGDIIAHPFGQAHMGLVQAVPIAAHLETGIGYPDKPFGAWRIFESESWRHYHWGVHEKDHWSDSGMNKEFSWVIPNYYDLDDWRANASPVGFLHSMLNPGSSMGWAEGKPYVIYMGRIDPNKGAVAAAVIARTWFEKYPRSNLGFLFAGQGDFEIVKKESKLGPDKLGYLGPVSGRIRSLIQGNARANIMPTRFIEPFGGSGVEGQLCGTPLIGSDYGAFTETVTPGVNGYRCKTLGDWIWALEHAWELDRERIARDARKRYSLDACRDKYIKAIECVRELCSGTGKGWTSGRSYALDNAGIVGSAFDTVRNPAVTVLPEEIQAKVTQNLVQRLADEKEKNKKLMDVIREMKKGEMVTAAQEVDEKAACAMVGLGAIDPFDTTHPDLVSSSTTVEGSSLPPEVPAGANGSGPPFTPEPGTNPETPLALSPFEQEAKERAQARIAARERATVTERGIPRLNPDQLRAVSGMMRGGAISGHQGLAVRHAPMNEARIRLDAAKAELERHRAFEASYWGDCTNTHEEEEKHYVYARLMGLNIETVPNRAGYYCWDVGGKTILDIGGGPVSMLLKAKNLKAGFVCDPTPYPKWVSERYTAKKITLWKGEGETEQDTTYDEVWIYNVLQHVRDPEKIIQNALRAAPVLRLFEWIDIPPHEGHPHMLTAANLMGWLGARATRVVPVLESKIGSTERLLLGSTVQLNERGCVGRAFYGVF